MDKGKADSKMDINKIFLSNFDENCWVREFREISDTSAWTLKKHSGD